MAHTVAQIEAQYPWLRAGQTATTAGAKFPVSHRMSGGTLLKFPPDASPPLPKGVSQLIYLSLAFRYSSRGNYLCLFLYTIIDC